MGRRGGADRGGKQEEAEHLSQADFLWPLLASCRHPRPDWLLRLPEPVGSVLAGSMHALAQLPCPWEQSATTIHPRTPPPPYLASQQASRSFSNACQLLKAPELSALVLRSGHLSPNDSQALTQGSFALRRQTVCHQRALYRRHGWAQVALCGRALLASWRGDVAVAGRLQLGVVSMRVSASLGRGPLSTQRDPPGLGLRLQVCGQRPWGQTDGCSGSKAET